MAQHVGIQKADTTVRLLCFNKVKATVLPLATPRITEIELEAFDLQLEALVLPTRNQNRRRPDHAAIVNIKWCGH